MVETVSNKPLTLGGMVLLAQQRAREALSKQTISSSASDDRLADVVQISAEAKARLAKARTVNSFLQNLSTYLKSINVPSSGMKNPSRFQRDV